jgi:protein TonB
MFDSHEYSALAGQHRSSSVLFPALLFSLAAHAAAGSLLFNGWQRSPIEPPRPLTVTLEAVAPLTIESPPPPAERDHVKHAVNSHAASARSPQHAPALAPVSVERADPTPMLVPPEAASPATPARASPAQVASPLQSDPVSQLGQRRMGARAIYQPMSEIPDELREKALDAVALVRFHVAPDGSAAVELLTPTPNPFLNRILLESLKTWRFIAAMEDGRTVASIQELRVRFEVK